MGQLKKEQRSTERTAERETETETERANNGELEADKNL